MFEKIDDAECQGSPLSILENFASVVDLKLYDTPYLIRMSYFFKLQKLEIKLYCPELESLQRSSIA
jgi:hypothetical protein